MIALSCAAIIAAIADAAERWRDADFSDRVRATRAIESRTGYTEPVVDFALDALFGAIDERTIDGVLASEIGGRAALDDFVSRPGRPDVTYRPREPALIISSDTTIGVTIPALVFALCAKANVRVKDRSDGLVAAFVQTLIEERPEFAAAVSVGTWSGAADDDAPGSLGNAAAIVVYGSDAALSAVRAVARPDATVVGFGHRTSIAFIAREDHGDRTSARALARDILLYDGEGCLSPHAIFIECARPEEARAFTQTLAGACDATAIEFPAGYPSPDAAVARYRDAALFRAAQGRGVVYGGTLAPHLIVLNPPRDEPPPFLRRTAAVYAVAHADEAAAFLAQHALPLEAVALSRARPDLESFALASGAARIATLGSLQTPPLGGDHGGAGRILPFVRAIYRA